MREADDISLSARERRTLHQLEKILRRQDRLLVLRTRSAGRWAGPPKREPGRSVRALTALSASLMVPAMGTSGRWTRRSAALAFGAVWLLAMGLAGRNARQQRRAAAPPPKKAPGA